MEQNDKKVLIIEDDSSLLKSLADNLAGEGYQIIEATDGADGFEKITKSNPDIILLDLVLPKMDGITIIKKVNESDQLRKIPIIILTNLDESEQVASAMEAGVYEYLQKTDWHIEDVVKKVKEKLEK